MSVAWKPTSLQAQVGLARLIAERTPHGWWRWSCYIGTRLVESGSVQDQRDALKAAEDAAAKHGQRSSA